MIQTFAIIFILLDNLLTLRKGQLILHPETNECQSTANFEFNVVCLYVRSH